MQKVADASGSKYGGGAATSDSSSAPKPAPPTSKPVFMPTRTGGSGFGTLGSRSRVGAGQSGGTDQDGWGEDAPQVTRSQLEKVESAYKPTKVNMAELTGQKQEPSRFQPQQREDTNGSGDVVRGGYQPIGKVDIAAIRRQAQESGQVKDDRPTTVKGSYEPVGKVDIAAIRAKAQQAPSPVPQTAAGGSQRSEEQEDERPKSLADRSAAFTQSERLTSMPKPKVANRFGSNTSSFAGTKAPTPVAPSKPIDKAAPVGIASRTFADEGGKTPAQIWAEKKARERGNSGAASNPPSAGFNKPTSPIQSQPSGGWSSGYTGKSWAPVQTTRTGTSNVSAQRTGEPEQEEEDVLQQPTGSIGSIRDRFKDAPPMGASNIGRSAAQDEDESFAPPPPLDTSSKPNAGVRGVPMPGLPTRPSQPQPEPEEVPEDVPEEEHFSVPPPPAVPRSPTPPTPEAPGSPIRVAMPVSRNAEPEPMEAPEEHFSPPPMPTESLAKAVSNTVAAPEDEEDDHDDAARGVAETAAASTFGSGAETAHPGAGVAGKTALIQYDYEKAEDNEIELREGEYVTNIEMVDEDWWMGQNSKGETGLFPSNYVELVEDGASDAGAGAPEAPEAAAQEEPDFHQHAAPPAAEAGGKTATAQYDYEAAEDNELSFPDGAVITGVVSTCSSSLALARFS